MKHLRILRYVDEVARTVSIRKAADHLNVTASAVNRRIMDLEEELGAQLFERRPRGVRLTAAGEVFVHYLREQDGGVERMKSQIEELRGLRRGTVRIACSQALALDFLPREIANFRTRHPLVSFAVKVLDHEQAIGALAAYEGRSGAGVSAAVPRQLPAADEPRAAARRGDVGRPSAGRPPHRQTARLRQLSGGVARAQPRRPAVARGGVGAQRACLQARRRIEFLRAPARARDPR